MVGAIFGGIVTVTLWYAKQDSTASRVGDVEPKVAVLRRDMDVAEADIKRLQENIISADKRMNDLRAALDASEKQAAEVRRTLELADSLAREERARLDQRLLGLEGHSAPLPLVPRAR